LYRGPFKPLLEEEEEIFVKIRGKKIRQLSIRQTVSDPNDQHPISDGLLSGSLVLGTRETPFNLTTAGGVT